MGDLMDAVPRLHPETGIQRVGGRLLAAGPPNALHTFYDEAGEPSEVAEAYLFLMRCGYATGQVVKVDGGMGVI